MQNAKLRNDSKNLTKIDYNKLYFGLQAPLEIPFFDFNGLNHALSPDFSKFLTGQALTGQNVFLWILQGPYFFNILKWYFVG